MIFNYLKINAFLEIHCYYVNKVMWGGSINIIVTQYSCFPVVFFLVFSLKCFKLEHVHELVNYVVFNSSERNLYNYKFIYQLSQNNMILLQYF